MLKEARALRKARSFRRNGSYAPQNSKGKGNLNKRKKDGNKKSDDKRLPMELATLMEAEILPRTKALQVHRFFVRVCCED